MTIQPTERLYLDDSLKLDFEASVYQCGQFDEAPSLLLDRSAFYPEGGGQPGDHGILEFPNATLQVVDTQVDEAGQVHHILDSLPKNLTPGQRVIGKVDETRRRDYMSQHTGQHLLSAAVEKLLGFETISARLGSKHGTIDVDGDVRSFTTSQIGLLEKTLNTMVLQDHTINTLYPSPQTLSDMGLRRAPKVQEGIRVIAVENFDCTPCGGTHCQRTGQVGPVKIIGTDRYKGLTRLTFLAGQRAIDYLASQDRLLGELTEEMGCAPHELVQHFRRMRDELKHQSQQMGTLRAQVIRNEVAELLEQLPKNAEQPHVLVRENEDLRSSRQLAAALAEHPAIIAMIASRESHQDDWRLILVRGSDQSFDCSGWFRGAGKIAGARGGGKPNRAEGRLGGSIDPNQLPFD